MREFWVEDQEFGDAIRAQIRCIHFAVGFKGGAGFQQRDPFHEVIGDCLTIIQVRAHAS